MSDEPIEPVEDQPEPPRDMGGLFTLTVTAEVVRGDQHDEDPEENR
jgi:hypothetical protein